MSLVFLSPVFLWLAILIPALWFLPRRATDFRHALIRSFVFLMLILALARPAFLKTPQGSHQIIIWDRSESVGSENETVRVVADLLEKLTPDARAHLIALNGSKPDAPVVAGVAPFPLAGSSLSRALDQAAHRIPDGARGAVTVVSDGLTTDPFWGDSVRRLAERNIPVHTVEVDPATDDVYPAGIYAPAARAGHTTEVIVKVVGRAPRAQVDLFAGDQPLAVSEIVSCSGRTQVPLEFEPAEPGLLQVEARVRVLEGTDAGPENNRFASSLAVQDPFRVLYLAERLRGSREKMASLLGSGVTLDAPSDAQLEQLAENPRRLLDYDLAVIDDRPADSIPRPVQDALVEAVKNQGLGLFYAGGKGAFGTGGYFDTPVASVLPVDLVQKEEKRDPSTTLVVIIDTSGSMGGERVQLAKECARLAIRRLLPHDKVGIVEFYGTKQWAAPIQTAANAIDIQRAINRLDAGGGTVVLPAIEEAFYALQNVQTRYKHVLVLTDGGVEAGDFESLMRRMAARGINVSTVLVGGDAHSEFLVNIANWGKGHFYAASNRFSIPEILLKQPSTSKIPPYRPGRHVVNAGGSTAWWGAIPRPAEPQLAGYVETQLRSGADAIIETEDERHPVLASWRYGLGRVTAMMSEPTGPGTGPWQNWPGYGSWLLRVLSRTAKEHSQPFAYSVERDLRGGRVVAQALGNLSVLPKAERLVGGEPESLTFVPRAPGLFTARLSAETNETIYLRAGAENWSGAAAHVVSPYWEATAPEPNVDPAQALDLAQLAAATGGNHLPLSAAAQLDPAPGGSGTALELLRLWPWCLLLALAGYLGDLIYRRWPGRSAAPGL